MTTQHSEPREGPRPLPLHLTTAINSWLSSQAALPLLKNGSIEWRPEVAARGAALSQRLASALAQSQKAAPNGNSPNPIQSNTDPFDQAVTREVFSRLQDLAAGIKTYRSHPYHRD